MRLDGTKCSDFCGGKSAAADGGAEDADVEERSLSRPDTNWLFDDCQCRRQKVPISLSLLKKMSTECCVVVRLEADNPETKQDPNSV